MDAIISGQASAMALIEGNDCYVVHSQEQEQQTQIDLGALRYLFAESSDLIFLKGTTKDDARAHLVQQVQSNDALHLALILLDQTKSEALRSEASSELDNLLSLKETANTVANFLYIGELPQNADIDEALVISKDFSFVFKFLSTLQFCQSSIARVRASWDSLEDELFDKSDNKQRFFTEAVKAGVFHKLSYALASNKVETFNGAVFDALSRLNELRNYRAIVDGWIRTLRVDKSIDFKKAIAVVETNELARNKYVKIDDRHQSGFESFQSVLQQQEAIKQQLNLGKLHIVRRYTDQLIDYQLHAGDGKFAAKTLCNLAQEANACGQYSLQLEWSQHAVDLAPDDLKTYGHLADAYVSLNRLDEALETLERIETGGDSRFANTERARIMRIQGRLDDALQAYKAIRDQFGHSAGNEFAWIGFAEVLRSMWKFSESVVAYDEAFAAYPDIVAVSCGRASLLTQLGRLDDAVAIYNDEINKSGGSSIILSGKAHVLKQKGDLDQSLELYERVIDKWPSCVLAICGHANVLRQKKRYDDAIASLKKARRTFIYEPSVLCELAEAYHDKGELDESLRIFDEACRKFPWDDYTACSKANLVKEMKNYPEALRLYDENIRRFPYDLMSRYGRADLLKKLGDCPNALKAYEEISMRWPDRTSAKYSKAAVLVVLNRYDEAEALLPTKAPQTEEDWIANHVLGMIHLKRNHIEKAIAHFSTGLQQVPFSREKKYFETALAAAYLRENKYDEALSVIETLEVPISNVLRLHAYAATGRKISADRILFNIEAQSSAKIIELSREIVRRYASNDDGRSQSDDWIFDKECDLLLLEAA